VIDRLYEHYLLFVVDKRTHIDMAMKRILCAFLFIGVVNSGNLDFPFLLNHCLCEFFYFLLVLYCDFGLVCE